MKRRSFILMSAMGTTAIIVPALGCHNQNESVNKVLAEPSLLLHICDEQTIREIGTVYRKQVTDESSEDQLVKILLTKPTSDAIPPSTDSAALRLILKQKIQNDFQKGHTVNIKGWVLSATEARQCAIFSLTKH